MPTTSPPVRGADSATDGMAQLMTACAGLVRQATNNVNGKQETEPPRVRLYTKSPDPKGSSSLLAIKDKEDEDIEQTVSGDAETREDTPPDKTPAATIAALKKGLTGEAAKEQSSKPLARPAAAPSALKRPASSLQKKAQAKGVSKPSSSMKAASAKQIKTKQKKTAASKSKKDKDARRKLCLSQIPQAVLKRYARGCSSCRHRKWCTVSCWIKRGYWSD